MIADHRLAKEIESHFYGYKVECKQLELIKKEIAEESTVPQMDGIRASSSKISDPTFEKTRKIEKELKKMQAWVHVVKKTIGRFQNTPQSEFITMVYIDRHSINRVCDNLYITRTTYFNWREKILDYALILAVENGIYKI